MRPAKRGLGSPVLEYADSSNQLDFFLHSSLALRYVQSNLSNTRDRKKLRNKSNLFSLMLFSLSPSVCFWSTNKKSMMALRLKQYCVPWMAKTFFRLFLLQFRRKMRLLSDGKLFILDNKFCWQKLRLRVRRNMNLVLPILVSPLFSY